MTALQPVPRILTLLVTIGMAVVSAVGFSAIRRDTNNLELITQDHVVWSASQLELELLRFKLSVTELASEASDVALDRTIARFNILWRRAFMLDNGRLGEVLRAQDLGFDAVDNLARYLVRLDPVLHDLEPTDAAAIDKIEAELTEFQSALRIFTLRVVRGDIAATDAVRDRLRTSAMVTAVVSLACVLVGGLLILLILRENRRQRAIAEMSQSIAAEARAASRLKSRFLSMVSHELRNPLNGALGALALLDQGGLPGDQARLVRQARQSGEAIERMLASLLEYGELQDGRVSTNTKPFRPAELAERIRMALADPECAGPRVDCAAHLPERVSGDLERIRQIFVNLLGFACDAHAPGQVTLRLSYADGSLVGEIFQERPDPDLEAQFERLARIDETQEERMGANAIRPTIARGLIEALDGRYAFAALPDGRRAMRVEIAAPAWPDRRIDVYLVTRSHALSAIYRAALRGDGFNVETEPSGSDTPDVVLIDASATNEDPSIDDLRARFGAAEFIALGDPEEAEQFDLVLPASVDPVNLRAAILDRVRAQV